MGKMFIGDSRAPLGRSFDNPGVELRGNAFPPTPVTHGDGVFPKVASHVGERRPNLEDVFHAVQIVSEQNPCQSRLHRSTR